MISSMLMVGPSANAEVLNFDVNSITNGYGGLQWDNFGVISGTSMPGSGYDTGTVSGTNTAFNMYGEPASFSSATAFTLNDAFFTGAWNNGLQIHVVATGGSNTYTTDFTVDTYGPTNIFFNWANLNSVSFFTSGGVQNSDLDGAGLHFAMDNLRINEVISPVPEPESYALMLAGLGLIGFMARRRENFSF
ncbi:MAG: PEP-CTERM sorting domain-containing protein [Gammaproteobacteria bacterium]|nr:PEP-CTERM sorting domain-containing protein [Gammaproteobacteria bacterium]MBU1776460.1 PEP-CTERM sorting domain-containing protein [Gammaproteobacteria bacterium]MBU1968724.1 PEP-CTERM sorting domain-containing protein [Gammaproteobacteria bacterium]